MSQNQQVEISLTVAGESGSVPLVRLSVPLNTADFALNSDFSKVRKVMEQINGIHNSRRVMINISPIDKAGNPMSEQKGAPDLWMVSIARYARTDGSMKREELLPFNTKPEAEYFARHLQDAFATGRKMEITYKPDFMKEVLEAQQRPSAEVLQIVRPAPTGFSPGV